MRVILKFKPLTSHSYDSVGPYDVQGLIYNLLRGTYFHKHHVHRGFKFFTFSNIFPLTDYSQGKTKTLIIASPSDNLAWHIYEQLKNRELFYLNNYPMEVVQVKKSFQKPRRNIITATPIVLYEDNTNNRYFSFKKDEFGFFFKRLENNGWKKPANGSIYIYDGTMYKIKYNDYGTPVFEKEIDAQYLQENPKTI